MVLKKLEELGYKPKKGATEEDNSTQVADILKDIKNSEAKQKALNLLLEALSETDPREILIYGMYVKNAFLPIMRGKQKDRIEKILEMLAKSVGNQ